MDTKKVWRNSRVFGAVTLVCLLAAAPVVADTPPNDPLHINSAGITSGELPAPLPVMPTMPIMPVVIFPSVDMSELPVLSDERAAVETLTANRVSAFRESMSLRYNDARASIAAVRSATQGVSDAIGDPMTLSVHDGTRRVTATAMAQEMAQSVSFSLGYVRAVSALGPMGLDLVFVFVGFGWILIINLLATAVRVIAAVIGVISHTLDALWKLAMLLMEVLRLVVAIFDLFWPL